MTLKAYDAMTGAEVKPGDVIRSRAAGLEYTFREAIRATTATRDGSIEVSAEPGRARYHAGLFGLRVTAVDEPALRAYREDDTEVRPGDTIDMRGIQHTFLAATVASNDAGDAGMVAIEGCPDMFSGPFGLTVRAVPAVDSTQWHSAGTDEPGDIRRDIRGAETVRLIQAASSDRSEPAEPVRDLQAILADLNAADHRTVKARNLSRELESAVRDKLTPVRGGTDALAAEADRVARTTAPPVPGITTNAGHTVYAVLGHKPASPGLLESWIVAAADDRGEHVTWNAYASDDGSGTLHYSEGHYHTPGEGTGDEALVDLANRAGIFRRLTELCSGMATRGAFQDSHAKVLTELAEVHGVGRAKVRSGLLEAAALGYARISWTTDGTRKDYGIRYDRVKCVFSWNREN